MLQVLNQADGEGRGGVERSPLTPHPQAIPTRPRGIKFPISNAVEFVNSTTGKELRLRGIYAKVVQAGEIQVGDRILKIDRKIERPDDRP